MDKCQACGRQWVNHYGISTTCKHLQECRSVLDVISVTCKDATIRGMAKRVLKKTKQLPPVPNLHEGYVASTTRRKDKISE